MTNEEREEYKRMKEQRSRDRAKAKAWREANPEYNNKYKEKSKKKFGQYVPNKYHHLDDPLAAYKEDQRKKYEERKLKLQSDPVAYAEFLAKQADWQRKHREKDPEGMRAYQREKQREWVAKNKEDVLRASAERFAQRKADEAFRQHMESWEKKRAEKLKKKK